MKIGGVPSPREGRTIGRTPPTPGTLQGELHGAWYTQSLKYWRWWIWQFSLVYRSECMREIVLPSDRLMMKQCWKAAKIGGTKSVISRINGEQRCPCMAKLYTPPFSLCYRYIYDFHTRHKIIIYAIIFENAKVNFTSLYIIWSLKWMKNWYSLTNLPQVEVEAARWIAKVKRMSF